MSVGDDVQIDVFVGVDVGKSDHHAVALDRSGGVILDRRCLRMRRGSSS